MTDYLVDNSVWARLASGDPAITARLRRIERAPSDLFVTCPQISLGFPLEHAPAESLVLDIRTAPVELGARPRGRLP